MINLKCGVKMGDESVQQIDLGLEQSHELLVLDYLLGSSKFLG